MDTKYIIVAVPFFLFLIGLEVVLSLRRKIHTYRLHDSINNLLCGMLSQIYNAVVYLPGFVAYSQVYKHLRWFEISTDSVLAWVTLFVLDDFCYYLYHRASHRVNFLWATHAVHHQSEEYNLAVALRQSTFTGLTGSLFYLPLALLGFPFAMYLVVRTLNTLYQFWIHTRPIGSLGFLEWFLNTPTHHRVHHGIDPRYIDKNHAGMFIVWDRLLGTFQPEAFEPVYGVVKPLASFNPVWANFIEWVRLYRIARQTARPGDKLKIWFMPPEWLPADCGGVVDIPEVSRQTQQKYDPRPPLSVSVYVVVNFLLTLGATVLFLLQQPHLGAWQEVLYLLELTVAMVTIGGLTEGRRWAPALEAARLASLCAIAALLPRMYGLSLLGLAVTLLGAGAAVTLAGRLQSPPPMSQP